MSFLMPDPPQPTPMPVAPSVDPDAERKRQDAEMAAIAERKNAGRRSTIVGGMGIAADEQYSRGLLASTRRRNAAVTGE